VGRSGVIQRGRRDTWVVGDGEVGQRFIRVHAYCVREGEGKAGECECDSWVVGKGDATGRAAGRLVRDCRGPGEGRYIVSSGGDTASLSRTGQANICRLAE